MSDPEEAWEVVGPTDAAGIRLSRRVLRRMADEAGDELDEPVVRTEPAAPHYFGGGGQWYVRMG